MSNRLVMELRYGYTLRSFSCFCFLKYLTHPTNSPKPHLLLSLQCLHSSFIPNLKHCYSTNPIHPLIPTSIPDSTQNTNHHRPMHAWLCGCDPLPIDFILDKCLWISWFPRLRFCGRFRNLAFTISLLSWPLSITPKPETKLYIEFPVLCTQVLG